MTLGTFKLIYNSQMFYLSDLSEQLTTQFPSVSEQITLCQLGFSVLEVLLPPLLLTTL